MWRIRENKEERDKKVRCALVHVFAGWGGLPRELAKICAEYYPVADREVIREIASQMQLTEYQKILQTSIWHIFSTVLADTRTGDPLWEELQALMFLDIRLPEISIPVDGCIYNIGERMHYSLKHTYKIPQKVVWWDNDEHTQTEIYFLRGREQQLVHATFDSDEIHICVCDPFDYDECDYRCYSLGAKPKSYREEIIYNIAPLLSDSPSFIHVLTQLYGDDRALSEIVHQASAYNIGLFVPTNSAHRSDMELYTHCVVCSTPLFTELKRKKIKRLHKRAYCDNKYCVATLERYLDFLQRTDPEYKTFIKKVYSQKTVNAITAYQNGGLKSPYNFQSDVASFINWAIQTLCSS